MSKFHTNLLSVMAAVIAMAVVCGGTAKADSGQPAINAPTEAAASTLSEQIMVLRRAIRSKRQEAWRWQDSSLKPRTKTAYRERHTRSLEFMEWIYRYWSAKKKAARHRALNPPHRRQWLCLYRYERNPAQGWRTHTGNGFYGGLQMDLDFQHKYGLKLLRKKGTANNWTPYEQMWVAERGLRVQGWYAWPHTARACGLI